MLCGGGRGGDFKFIILVLLQHQMLQTFLSQHHTGLDIITWHGLIVQTVIESRVKQIDIDMCTYLCTDVGQWTSILYSEHLRSVILIDIIN